MKWIKYEYKSNQKVLLELKQKNKYGAIYDGPYQIIMVWNNGTVTIQKNTKHEAILDHVNICQIHPYKD